MPIWTPRFSLRVIFAVTASAALACTCGVHWRHGRVQRNIMADDSLRVSQKHLYCRIAYSQDCPELFSKLKLGRYRSAQTRIWRAFKDPCLIWETSFRARSNVNQHLFIFSDGLPSMTGANMNLMVRTDQHYRPIDFLDIDLVGHFQDGDVAPDGTLSITTSRPGMSPINKSKRRYTFMLTDTILELGKEWIPQDPLGPTQDKVPNSTHAKLHAT